MRAPAKALPLLAALAALGGCSLPPNPVVARDPLPPPNPRARITCYTTPPVILNTAIAACAPVEKRKVMKRRTAVRAKG